MGSLMQKTTPPVSLPEGKSALDHLKTLAPHKDVSPAELKQILDDIRSSGREAEVQLIDVREPRELKDSSVPGFKNFPLSQMSSWGPTIATALDPNMLTLVMCHHGSRSSRMCHFLRNENFRDVRNISGGINKYSGVDPSIPRY
eukprot:TRINITY_DN11487_c0_g1_i1.p1 TRINITY_DN11487_c0_g1~~TRINITY_DN11487_c0_g1_i1.p1  ORF type:complete len:144 (+),score=28.27 TRINITY_DN11487_c0_g1_i1:70-501(+)